MHLAEVGQGDEAVPEARWHHDLPHVLRAKLDPKPLPERGRANPQIHGHIEDAADRAANQLAHWRGHILVMQTSQDLVRRARMVVLDEPVVQSVLLEALLVVVLDEEPALVSKIVGLDYEDTLQLRREHMDLHRNRQPATTACGKRGDMLSRRIPQRPRIRLRARARFAGTAR